MFVRRKSRSSYSLTQPREQDEEAGAARVGKHVKVVERPPGYEALMNFIADPVDARKQKGHKERAVP